MKGMVFYLFYFFLLERDHIGSMGWKKGLPSCEVKNM